MSEDNSNGWMKWSMHVLKELERLNNEIKFLHERIDNLEKQFSKMCTDCATTRVTIKQELSFRTAIIGIGSSVGTIIVALWLSGKI